MELKEDTTLICPVCSKEIRSNIGGIVYGTERDVKCKKCGDVCHVSCTSNSELCLDCYRWEKELAAKNRIG